MREYHDPNDIEKIERLDKQLAAAKEINKQHEMESTRLITEKLAVEKENELKAAWLTRIHHAFEEYRLYHECQATSTFDSRKHWLLLKAAVMNQKPAQPETFKIGDPVKTIGNAMTCSDDLEPLGKDKTGIICHGDCQTVCVKFDNPIPEYNYTSLWFLKKDVLLITHDCRICMNHDFNCHVKCGEEKGWPNYKPAPNGYMKIPRGAD
jgi:hypothetical protein